MSGQSLWNPARGGGYTRLTREKAERPDMSGLGARHVRPESLESSVEAGHIWLPKPDTPVLTGMRIEMNLGTS
jgi:hypothetical protein